MSPLMIGLIDTLLYILMGVVFLTLVAGIYTLFRGGDFGRSWSNKLMRARVLFQFLAVLVIVLQFSTELFMTRHYGLAMVSFTPVILLLGQLAAPADPGVLVTERAVETLVGAAVGIAVVVLIRRRR